ncbi:basic salivary proline-rich protein 2-like, partial [Penaeus indicus]|uniref:basic salivary proline-rich protein 2-like n=1 Tax=Penaeus indicus TaxID=29960 RepID=UPI00300D471F
MRDRRRAGTRASLQLPKRPFAQHHREQGPPPPARQGGHPLQGDPRPRRTAASLWGPPRASLPRPQSPLRRRRREEGGPDQGLPAWTTTNPARGRRGADHARDTRPRPRGSPPTEASLAGPGAARPPASQPANASEPPSSPYTCRRGRSAPTTPNRPPSRPPVKAHAPSQPPTDPRDPGLARAPGRPGGPGARSPAAARNTAGRSCSEAGNVLHGRTKRPRGEGQRARVVEKGALPARKANGNGGKRPSAHGLPACLPSVVRPPTAATASSNPCRQPTVTAGGRRRPGRPAATAMGPPPRPARLALSQPLARTSRAPSIGLAARPFTHHDREQVLPLLLSHRVEGSEERRRQPVYRLRGQTPLAGEILVNPPPAGPAKCPGN